MGGGGIPKSQTHQAVIKGETHHFFCINSAVREPNGEPFGTSTIALDVTALRVNEAELERTPSVMESLLAHYPFPVVARDMDGRIMLVNNAWEDSRAAHVVKRWGGGQPTSCPLNVRSILMSRHSG